MIRIAEVPRDIIATGRWGYVEYAIRLDESKEAKEFLRGLRTHPSMRGKGEEVERRILVLCQMLANDGWIRDTSRFSGEDGEIHGLKYERFNKLIRFACFRSGNRWVLTHGFFKPGAQKGKGRWRPQEITRAMQIMNEHQSRFGEGG